MNPGSGSISWLLLGGLAIGAAVAAGGSGGSDDGSSGPDNEDGPPQPGPITEPDPIADPLPDTPEVPPGSGFETMEYERNYALGMINAADRYEDGGTGAGTILSIFDTGADLDHADLSGKAVYSHSYFFNNDDVRDYVGHGTHVASIMAGKRNGIGAHGVAFDADLAIFQGLHWTGAPSLSGGMFDAVAHAQRRSVELGAVAINHSWAVVDEHGNERIVTEFTRTGLADFLGQDLIGALEDSRDAGLVSVFANGNDGRDHPSVLGGIPVHFSEFKDSILTVGSVDRHNRLDDSSNRCGVAKDVCLVAPGVQIYGALSSDAGEYDHGYMTGTSMAAPHVAAAIGVVKSNFPELTGTEISRILRDTATDLGADGIDDLYGHGLLNLENAVKPQGTITIPTHDHIAAGEIALDESWVAGNAPVAAAIASSLSGTSMMVLDRYDRGYSADMGALVTSSGGAKMAAADGALARFTQTASALVEPGKLSFTPEGLPAQEAGIWADAGAFASAYSDLVAAPVIAFSGDTPAGRMTLRSALGADGAAYASAELQAQIGDGHSVSVEAGHLSESGAMLGTRITGAFGDGLESDTRFARLGARLQIEDGFAIKASASMGRTDFSSNGIFSAGRDISSSALGLGIETRGVFDRSDSFTIGVSQPLALQGGRMTIDAPVAIAAAAADARGTSVQRQRSDIDLDGSRAMTDIQFGYTRNAFGGRMSFGGVWRPEAGNAVSLSAGLRFAL